MPAPAFAFTIAQVTIWMVLLICPAAAHADAYTNS